MTKLPEHIITAIKENETSLGDNPAFPMGMTGERFLFSLLSKRYGELETPFLESDEKSLRKELYERTNRCKGIERKCKQALEELCVEIVTELFRIPDDAVKLEAELSESKAPSKTRMTPENDEEYSFDDINDIDFMSYEVYKRRMVNALVQGASEYYAYNLNNYVQKLFKIDPELPGEYSKIIALSQYLTFKTDDTELESIGDEGGWVEVRLNQENELPSITACGCIFPILLQQLIKGVLELCAISGLPSDKKKALYIMKRSDFAMATKWDSRLGYPLWERIVKIAEDSGHDLAETGYNFFLMELAKADATVFNEALQEMFADTNKGKTIAERLCDYIENERETDEFNDYVEQSNAKYPIEDGYFTAEELIKGGEQLCESVQNNVELSLEIRYNYHINVRSGQKVITDFVIFGVECRDLHNGFTDSVAAYSFSTPEEFNKETYDVSVHTSNFSDYTDEIVAKLGGGKSANFAYDDEPHKVFLRSRCNIKPFVMKHLKRAIINFKKDTYYPKWQKERVFAVLQNCGVIPRQNEQRNILNETTIKDAIKESLRNFFWGIC